MNITTEELIKAYLNQQSDGEETIIEVPTYRYDNGDIKGTYKYERESILGKLEREWSFSFSIIDYITWITNQQLS